MGPNWGPTGSCRPQMGPIWAPWTLLSGYCHPSCQSTRLIYRPICEPTYVKHCVVSSRDELYIQETSYLSPQRHHLFFVLRINESLCSLLLAIVWFNLWPFWYTMQLFSCYCHELRICSRTRFLCKAELFIPSLTSGVHGTSRWHST